MKYDNLRRKNALFCSLRFIYRLCILLVFSKNAIVVKASGSISSKHDDLLKLIGKVGKYFICENDDGFGNKIKEINPELNKILKDNLCLDFFRVNTGHYFSRLEIWSSLRDILEEFFEFSNGPSEDVYAQQRRLNELGLVNSLGLGSVGRLIFTKKLYFIAINLVPLINYLRTCGDHWSIFYNVIGDIRELIEIWEKVRLKTPYDQLDISWSCNRCFKDYCLKIESFKGILLAERSYQDAIMQSMRNRWGVILAISEIINDITLFHSSVNQSENELKRKLQMWNDRNLLCALMGEHDQLIETFDKNFTDIGNCVEELLVKEQECTDPEEFEFKKALLLSLRGLLGYERLFSWSFRDNYKFNLTMECMEIQKVQEENFKVKMEGCKQVANMNPNNWKELFIDGIYISGDRETAIQRIFQFGDRLFTGTISFMSLLSDTNYVKYLDTLMVFMGFFSSLPREANAIMEDRNLSLQQKLIKLRDFYSNVYNDIIEPEHPIRMTLQNAKESILELILELQCKRGKAMNVALLRQEEGYIKYLQNYLDHLTDYVYWIFSLLEKRLKIEEAAHDQLKRNELLKEYFSLVREFFTQLERFSEKIEEDFYKIGAILEKHIEDFSVSGGGIIMYLQNNFVNNDSLREVFDLIENYKIDTLNKLQEVLDDPKRRNMLRGLKRKNTDSNDSTWKKALNGTMNNILRKIDIQDVCNSEHAKMFQMAEALPGRKSYPQEGGMIIFNARTDYNDEYKL